MKQLVDISKLDLNRKIKKFSDSFICGKGYSPPSGGEELFVYSLNDEEMFLCRNEKSCLPRRYCRIFISALTRTGRDLYCAAQPERSHAGISG